LIFPTSGLYVITQPENNSIVQTLEAVEQALQGGAVVVQYRDKNPIDAEQLASRLLTLCHQYDAPLIINDAIDLAAHINADGVHLGKEDGLIQQAKTQLGESAIIGVSCYNALTRAVEAEQQGATYAAFGRFFPSDTKPLAAPADIETLSLARQQLKLPLVAIGGILPSNGKALLTAGADFLAVVGGVFNENPRQSAQNYGDLFN